MTTGGRCNSAFGRIEGVEVGEVDGRGGGDGGDDTKTDAQHKASYQQTPLLAEQPVWEPDSRQLFGEVVPDLVVLRHVACQGLPERPADAGSACEATDSRAWRQSAVRRRLAAVWTQGSAGPTTRHQTR